MSITNKILCRGTFGSSNATLYTTPGATTTLVKAVTICNKTAATRNFTIKFHGTEVVMSHNIIAYNSLTIPFFDQMLNATELIEGSADSVASVNYYISGKEIT